MTVQPSNGVSALTRDEKQKTRIRSWFDGAVRRLPIYPYVFYTFLFIKSPASFVKSLEDDGRICVQKDGEPALGPDYFVKTMSTLCTFVLGSLQYYVLHSRSRQFVLVNLVFQLIGFRALTKAAAYIPRFILNFKIPIGSRRSFPTEAVIIYSATGPALCARILFWLFCAAVFSGAETLAETRSESEGARAFECAWVSVVGYDEPMPWIWIWITGAVVFFVYAYVSLKALHAATWFQSLVATLFATVVLYGVPPVAAVGVVYRLIRDSTWFGCVCLFGPVARDSCTTLLP